MWTHRSYVGVAEFDTRNKVPMTNAHISGLDVLFIIHCYYLSLPFLAALMNYILRKEVPSWERVCIIAHSTPNREDWEEPSTAWMICMLCCLVCLSVSLVNIYDDYDVMLMFLLVESRLCAKCSLAVCSDGWTANGCHFDWFTHYVRLFRFFSKRFLIPSKQAINTKLCYKLFRFGILAGQNQHSFFWLFSIFYTQTMMERITKLFANDMLRVEIKKVWPLWWMSDPHPRLWAHITSQSDVCGWAA